MTVTSRGRVRQLIGWTLKDDCRLAYVGKLGPLFDEHVDKPVAQRPFKGSAMVVNEKSWEGFMQEVGSDIYIQEGIWDLEKTLFIPFRTLMRSGM